MQTINAKPSGQQPALLREPMATYQAQRREYMTSHQLADFRRCPQLHRRKWAGLVPERRGEAFLIGAAAHCLTLEGPEEFEREYVVGGPINPKTERPYGSDTKAYAEWASQQTRTAISDEQCALVCHLAHSVRSHDRAAWLLHEGLAEGVLRTRCAAYPCQIRLDWFCDQGIVDLKTCDDLDQFPGDIERWGYVQQLAFYREIVRLDCGVLSPCYLVGVEKREPYRTGVWKIRPSKLAVQARENYAALDFYTACLEDDCWPTHYEELRSY